MANILYGVSGEGSGHSSRAKEVTNFLQSQGHNVFLVSYDRGYKNLSQHFKVEKIFGLQFAMEDNEVKYIATVFKNLWSAPEAKESIEKILRIIEEKSIQLVITDFEPLTAAIANIKRLPLISLDNQHRLTKAKCEYPKKYEREAVTARMITKLIIPKADVYLSTTFFPLHSQEKKALFFPPILRKEVLSLVNSTTEEDYILVYFTSEFKQIIDVLKQVNKNFICYGFNVSKKVGNVTFKKASQQEFLEDLQHCQGVIANAGFSLMTEALYLHKPYLALPVKGQFEQIINAYYLEKLGYGRYYDELDRDRIEAFLFNLPYFREKLQKYPQQTNEKLFSTLEKLINRFVPTLKKLETKSS